MMDENILKDSWEPRGTTSDEIKKRIKADKARFWAGDNVSKYLEEGDKQKLIEELTPKFESVLDSLLIDRENDPNSNDTGRRLAKMYINELMAGRYNPNAQRNCISTRDVRSIHRHTDSTFRT